MKIGIDCRMMGLAHAGIGRYVENLVDNLLDLDEKNEYVFLVRDNPKESQSLKVKCQNYKAKVKIVKVDIPHYSLKEQLLLPGILAKEKVDLMHFPHFNVPIFYPGRFVVTIHDLIKHTSRGRATTTKSPLIYWLKYLGYRLVFALAVKRARRILVPSQFIKDKLLKEYNLKTDKVKVTYEGVDLKISNSKLQISHKAQILEKYKIKKPYILYVGSVYPHKNIERLIEAVKLVNSDQLSALRKKKSIADDRLPITLVVVCARSVFWEKLKKKIQERKATHNVNLVGFIPDEELGVLYQEASAFVFPSLSEGFGLPGLEAMAMGVPLVCSDIPVFREIYKDGAVYFNPLDPADMADKIKNLLADKVLQQRLKKQALRLAKSYSWSEMALQTLAVYNQALR